VALLRILVYVFVVGMRVLAGREIAASSVYELFVLPPSSGGRDLQDAGGGAWLTLAGPLVERATIGDVKVQVLVTGP